MTHTPTRRWQFSLLTLLIAMSGVSLVCLALRTPNELWATAVFAAAVFSLGFAALAAVYRNGRTRAFAVGFLILGAGYWSLVFLAEREQTFGPYGQPRLPTTRWGIMLFTLLHQDDVNSQIVTTAVYPATAYAQSVPLTVPYAAAPPATPTVTTYFRQQIRQPRFSAETFLDISQQSLVMLLGVMGGIVAQWLYATRKNEESQVAAPTV